MAPPPAALIPEPGERGFASSDPSTTAVRIAAAWDGFLAVAQETDLDAPSRVPGWSGRDVLVHLGSWPEQPALTAVLEGRADQDARNAALIAAHGSAGRDEILAALVANRDAVAAFLAAPDAGTAGARLTGSVLGPLPLLTLLSAVAYELAVHALDLAPCGAPAPSGDLLQAGVAALVDVTGGLAARTGISAVAAVQTPGGSWAFASDSAGDWRVRGYPAGRRPERVTIEGAADVLLDASAGRRAVPPLLLRGEVHTHDVPGLLALAPLVEAVPGLPGGASLGTAARYLGGVGRLARRLPGLRG